MNDNPFFPPSSLNVISPYHHHDHLLYPHSAFLFLVSVSVFFWLAGESLNFSAEGAKNWTLADCPNYSGQATETCRISSYIDTQGTSESKPEE